jgi:hypothetical protein
MLDVLCWDSPRQTSRSWYCHLVGRRGFGAEGTLLHYQSVALDTNCCRMGLGGRPRKKANGEILVGIIARSLLSLKSRHRSIQLRCVGLGKTYSHCCKSVPGHSVKVGNVDESVEEGRALSRWPESIWRGDRRKRVLRFFRRSHRKAQPAKSATNHAPHFVTKIIQQQQLAPPTSLASWSTSYFGLYSSTPNVPLPIKPFS